MPTDTIYFESTYNADFPYVCAVQRCVRHGSAHDALGLGAGQPLRSPDRDRRVRTLGNISRIVIAGYGGSSTVDNFTYNAP